MGMTIAIDKSYMNKMPNSCKECPLTYLDTGDDAYFGANERRCIIDDSCIDGMVSERACDCPLVEAIPKADYENRLKADLKAILVELQLKIEENTVRWYVGRVDGKSDDVVLLETINDIIQEKINELEVEQDPTPQI